MVYNIKKSNGQPLVSIPDSTQDTTASSLILPGRNSLNFGLSIDQNFVNLLQNFAANSPPPNPLEGQLWYDAVGQALNIYDSNRWIQVMSSFDGAGGVTSQKIGINGIDITAIISQYQIIMVISAERIEASDCPDSIIFNDTSYAFAARFPNGIFPGINMAIDPAGLVSYVVNGISTHANQLTNARTVTINGSSTGSFQFDGSQNVNVSVSDSNVYIINAAGYTTNVTVGGTWTKVLVGDGGRILEGNNITAGDVVEALGFTPWDAANISVDAVANTIVGRDANANFATNVLVAATVLASDVLASGTMSATDFIGTAANARVLTTPRTIHINGHLYGNVQFDGSSDVVMTTNLPTFSNLAGTYSRVYVDDTGRVTRGGYTVQPPESSIMLYSQNNVPSGWAICDGRTVTDSMTGTIYTTPNLVVASDSINSLVPSGSGITLKYIMKYSDEQTSLTPGVPNPGTTVIISNASTFETVSPSVSSALSGGPAINSIPGGFGNISIGLLGSTISNPTVRFSNTTFADTEYFDAVALVMGLGDFNGIMFSRNDVWKDLASLTVAQLRDNLILRASENLPPAVGKYMLPYKLIDDQLKNLDVPDDFQFSALFQDQLISVVTSNFAHRLAIAGLPTIDNNLWASHYLGSADALAKILKSPPGSKVSEVLINNGYYVTTTSNLDQHTKESFLQIMAQILLIAKDEVRFRSTTGQNVIVSGENIQVIEPSFTVDGEGYYIGNSDIADLGGGYFPEYDVEAPGESDPATATAPGSYGSVGTVSVTLADAGAAALAGVLQTDIDGDQYCLAQLCINRAGSGAKGIANYGGLNTFECATVVGAFSALSAAIYGPNSNSSASTAYGDLFINTNDLRNVLSLKDPEDCSAGLGQLFKDRLSNKQLTNITELRKQVFTNGPKLKIAQAAISGAVNYLTADTTSTNVIRPFGDQATAYSLSTPIDGFFAPNLTDNSTLAPAPSPEALLNRLRANLISRLPPPLPIIERFPDRQCGTTRSISWQRYRDNVNAAGGVRFTLSTRVSSINPNMQVGDRFSIVVGSAGSWINREAEVYEFYYTYGTSLNNPVIKLFNFRKSCWLVCWYDGNDTFNSYTYYAGDDTDNPFNTTYHMSYRWWGNEGQPAGTVVNLNSSVAAYAAANPAQQDCSLLSPELIAPVIEPEREPVPPPDRDEFPEF